MVDAKKSESLYDTCIANRERGGCVLIIYSISRHHIVIDGEWKQFPFSYLRLRDRPLRVSGEGGGPVSYVYLDAKKPI